MNVATTTKNPETAISGSAEQAEDAYLADALQDPLAAEAAKAARVDGQSKTTDQPVKKKKKAKKKSFGARFKNGFRAISKSVRKGIKSIGDDRRKDVRSDAHDIPTQDIVYEQLAHAGAYGKLDNNKLEAWGYQETQVIDDTATGFRGVLYTPIAQSDGPKAKIAKAIHGGKAAPVLALRGTANLKGLQDDVNIQGVGSYQFRANRATISQMLGMAGGDAVVCGHSLGGALAQLTAVHLSGVGRVVTFQSPGIDQDDADAFKKKQAQKDEKDRVKSTHYRKDGDILHAAGDALTDGDVFKFHSRGIDNPLAHTHFPLARLNEARGGLVPGVTGKGQEAATENLTRVERTTTDEEKGDLTNRFTEGGRKVFGGLLRKDNQDAYTQLWKSTEQMVESGSYSAARIEAVIDASEGISIEQKSRMRTQAHQMLESRNT